MCGVKDCLLCRVTDADAFFERTRVWQDDLWRLSVVRRGAITGFAHLEPHRHIPFITDLDGPEAASLGGVLARCTSAIRAATGADKIYVYVFGDRVPHLHLNLAPNDLLTPGVTLDAPPASIDAHIRVAEEIRRRIAQ